jgi:hypothetical protein
MASAGSSTTRSGSAGTCRSGWTLSGSTTPRCRSWARPTRWPAREADLPRRADAAGARELWAEQEQERHPYALVNPVYNPDGSIAAMGPIGKIEPPTAAARSPPRCCRSRPLTSRRDRRRRRRGQGQHVRRGDGHRGHAGRCEVGHLPRQHARSRSSARAKSTSAWLARSITSPGRRSRRCPRTARTEATLQRILYRRPRANKVKNDFTQGKYKVIVDVTEATATRRDKTVKSMLHTATVAVGRRTWSSRRWRSSMRS